MTIDPPPLDPPVPGRYRVGTASWTDPTLLAAGFYPPNAKTAESRLRFYAEHFDTVEVDSTYYALPSPKNAFLWAERTPPPFLFHIKAFAWLTQHEAETRALPQVVRARLSGNDLARARLASPTAGLRDLTFDLFLAALEPLRDAGKLGHLLFQFPPWFVSSEQNRAYLQLCRERCASDAVAVEFRHPSWMGTATEATLAFLRQQRLTFVVTDAPSAPGIPLTPYRLTTDEAYVRLHGRDRTAWFRRSASAAERFRYLYSDRELAEVADRLRPLASARRANILFNNCYADYGVRNALTLRTLLGA